MNELLMEFLKNILTETSQKPKDAKYSSGGRWYSDQAHKNYVGRFVNRVWTPAAAEKVAAAKKTRGSKPPTKQTGSTIPTEPQEEPIRKLPTSLSDEGKTATMEKLNIRVANLEDRINNGRKSGKSVTNFENYKKSVQKLLAIIKTGNVEEIATFFEERAIATYTDLLTSQIFYDSAKDLAQNLEKYLPGLLTGTLESATKEAGILSSISARSLSGTKVTPTEEGTTDLDHALKEFEFTTTEEASIRQKLTGKSDEEIENTILRIRARVHIRNKQIETIRKFAEAGHAFIELERGAAGISQLTEHLTRNLFSENEDLQNEFNTLISDLTNTQSSANEIKTAWTNIHTFLVKHFSGQNNVIPTICEYVKAMQVLAAEPTVTVYLPTASNFPTGDVVIVRHGKNENLFIELADTQYIERIEFGSVKRYGGAPSSYRKQMNLTVMRDDEVMDNPENPRNENSPPRSREVLLSLVDGNTTFDENSLTTLERQFELTFESPDLQVNTRRLNNIKTCLCKGKGRNKTECTAEAKKLHLINQRKERLFNAIYEKMVLEQGYTNTTYSEDTVYNTNGRTVKAIVKPDFRFVCGTPPRHAAIEAGKRSIRAYLVAPKAV